MFFARAGVGGEGAGWWALVSYRFSSLEFLLHLRNYGGGRKNSKRVAFSGNLANVPKSHVDEIA